MWRTPAIWGCRQTPTSREASSLGCVKPPKAERASWENAATWRSPNLPLPLPLPAGFLKEVLTAQRVGRIVGGEVEAHLTVGALAEGHGLVGVVRVGAGRGDDVAGLEQHFGREVVGRLLTELEIVIVHHDLGAVLLLDCELHVRRQLVGVRTS